MWLHLFTKSLFLLPHPRIGCLSVLLSEAPYLRLVDLPSFTQCQCPTAALSD